MPAISQLPQDFGSLMSVWTSSKLSSPQNRKFFDENGQGMPLCMPCAVHSFFALDLVHYRVGDGTRPFLHWAQSTSTFYIGHKVLRSLYRMHRNDLATLIHDLPTASLCQIVRIRSARLAPG